MDPEQTGATGPAQSVRVVVIDDQAIVVECVRRALAERSDVSVVGYSDPADALMHLRSRGEPTPQLVVVDLMMPGIPGFDVITALRDLDTTASVPIVALTASDDATTAEQARAVGASEVVVKMPAPPVLRSTLLAWLDRGQDLRAEARHIDAIHEHRLGAMEQSAGEIAQLNDPETVLVRVLTDARAFTHCEAGGVFVREGGVLKLRYAQNDVLSGTDRFIRTVSLPIDTSSIAGYVASMGRILHVPDAYAIPSSAPYHFNRSIDQHTGFHTRSILSVPLLGENGRCIGVFQLINPKRRDGSGYLGFEPADIGVATRYAAMVSMSVQRAQLTKSLIDRMIAMARLRDPSETGPHVRRVSRISRILMEAWGARRGRTGSEWERELDRFALASMLHDVGKVGVPDAVLKKPGPLDPAERAVMERHTTIGAELFGDDREFDSVAKRIALNHHQRFDGHGYPPVAHDAGADRPLSGDAIPLEARIVAVADVYDALSARRCYKEAWPEERVLDLFAKERGKQFDPEIVDLFLEHLDICRQILAADREEGVA